jgi:hypothetical protein
VVWHCMVVLVLLNLLCTVGVLALLLRWHGQE